MRTRCPDCKKEFDAPDGAEVFFCPECGGRLMLPSAEKDGGPTPDSESAEDAGGDARDKGDAEDEARAFAKLLDAGAITREEYDERVKSLQADTGGTLQNDTEAAAQDSTAAPGEQTQPAKKKMSREKRNAIIGVPLLALAVIGAIVAAAVFIQPQGNNSAQVKAPEQSAAAQQDATRAKGELPNLPLVMAQMGDWDDSTWKKKMNYDNPQEFKISYDFKGFSDCKINGILQSDDPEVLISFDGDDYGSIVDVFSFMTDGVYNIDSSIPYYCYSQTGRATYYGKYDEDTIDEITDVLSNYENKYQTLHFSIDDAIHLLESAGVNIDDPSSIVEIDNDDLSDSFLSKVYEMMDKYGGSGESKFQNEMYGIDHSYIYNGTDANGVQTEYAVTVHSTGTVSYTPQNNNLYIPEQFVVWPRTSEYVQLDARHGSRVSKSESDSVANRSNDSDDSDDAVADPTVTVITAKGVSYKNASDYTDDEDEYYDYENSIFLKAKTKTHGTVTGWADPDGEGYVLADSDTNLYSVDELEDLDLTDAELCIAWNEPYAREGYHFSNSTLQNYFDNCDWYIDSGEKFDLDEDSIAAKNVARLHKVADSRGSEWTDLVLK